MLMLFYAISNYARKVKGNSISIKKHCDYTGMLPGKILLTFKDLGFFESLILILSEYNGLP